MADKFHEKLCGLLMVEKMNIALAKNICLCIGRVGLCHPELMATKLPQIGKNWSLTMRLVAGNSNEKSEAFRGFLKMTAARPELMVDYLAYFLACIISYKNCP
jgi:transportin-1